MKPTRRDVLVTIAAAAAPPASGQTAQLSTAEMESLKAIVDTIIPRTETPGAVDAGVPGYIERRLVGSATLLETFRTGIAALDAAARSRFGASLAALGAERRLALLTANEKAPFVAIVKGLTVDGYYTSQEGLTQELGWHGNTFLAEFKGCTHPEHQS